MSPPPSLKDVISSMREASISIQVALSSLGVSAALATAFTLSLPGQFWSGACSFFARLDPVQIAHNTIGGLFVWILATIAAPAPQPNSTGEARAEQQHATPAAPGVAQQTHKEAAKFAALASAAARAVLSGRQR